MFFKRTATTLIFIVTILLPAVVAAKDVVISNSKISITLSYGDRVSISSLIINGQKIVSGADGVFTSVNVGGVSYSSLKLKAQPVFVKTGKVFKINHIIYGDKDLTINENWTFTVNGSTVKWAIDRTTNKPLTADEAATPVFNFDSINTWEGAYQGYGGVAWFYLFNEKLCTYGVHTRSSDFWNSKTGNGLNIAVDAPGKEVAMRYVRTNDDKLAYTITTSGTELMPKHDAGTNRRRFIRGRTDVWAPFNIAAGLSKQTITFSYFDYDKKYGRGTFKGIEGDKVGAVLNTIARIGVIDSLHHGGNSWHTPYGPICLHEQYIAQLGLAINDPKFLNGNQSSLDYYRDYAIKPDGRVFSRWAYTNEDASKGQFNKEGFYEAQWGTLMDSNTDLVTNISELYDLTGDLAWVKKHQQSCEKVLEWILKRDENNNGLVEMINDNTSQKRSSDWIDIVWASYENAFVNAKLYIALTKWAAIEQQLSNTAKAKYYVDFAAKLKVSFNRPTSQGGFWDEQNGCYIYWIDKDKSIHGRNMVTPVNFMAIAYGICDDPARTKTILDNIETQMLKENLFFWPLAMSTYAPGEAKDSQYPFPSYENGDLFLSWGAVAVKAYANYDPAIAVKYVKKVLEQYGKDGLAFQRYGRVKQEGLGDDILSGNGLTVVGLYQAIYGINPLYNRLYLDPHITPELAGTALTYNFRNEKLTIGLNNKLYTIAGKKYKVTADKSFGFNTTGGVLSYFEGSAAKPALQAKTTNSLSIQIKNCDANSVEWQQANNAPVTYTLSQLEPNRAYTVAIAGKRLSVKTNIKGQLTISQQTKANTSIKVSLK